MTKAFVSIAIICLLWTVALRIFPIPPYLLPSPLSVMRALHAHWHLILINTGVTIVEMLAGWFIGIIAGCLLALTLQFFQPLRRCILPLLIASQALPVFTVAPLFVIWLGYGIATHVTITALMLFFPVTHAFYDGLQQTPHTLQTYAASCHAKKWRYFWHIRAPAALPAFASGLRIATAIAPMGAIISEWVGASGGLGFLLLSANATLQIDLMFAELLVLVTMTLTFYFTVDRVLKKCIFW